MRFVLEFCVFTTVFAVATLIASAVLWIGGIPFKLHFGTSLFSRGY